MMKMKNLAVAMALACGSTLAFATDPGTSPEKRGATDGSPKGNAASAYWTEHSKGGYMTREQAMNYKGQDDKPIDWGRLNTDTDDRVSEAEWTAYHNEGATKSDGTKDAGADERAGAAGPTGGVEASGSAGASSDVKVNQDAPKDSDPSSGGRGSN